MFSCSFPFNKPPPGALDVSFNLLLCHNITHKIVYEFRASSRNVAIPTTRKFMATVQCVLLFIKRECYSAAIEGANCWLYGQCH